MFGSIEDAERFEKHLKRLAEMTPEEKRKYSKRIDSREADFVSRHIQYRVQHEYDLEARAIASELKAEENGTDN